MSIDQPGGVPESQRLMSTLMAGPEGENRLPESASKATEVASVHVDDGYGFCEGCKSEYSFAIPHPCTVRQWADRTLIIESTAR